MQVNLQAARELNSTTPDTLVGGERGSLLLPKNSHSLLSTLSLSGLCIWSLEPRCSLHCKKFGPGLSHKPVNAGCNTDDKLKTMLSVQLLCICHSSCVVVSC